jgi:hypothetical protein
MPRVSPAARATAVWRAGGSKPQPPNHLSAKARKIWQAIVDDRPADWFRPGYLLLLEQLCSTMVGQRAVLAELEQAPHDPELIKAAKDYAAIINATATKLRLTVQAELDRDSRKVHEKEPAADVLLGVTDWKRTA